MKYRKSFVTNSSSSSYICESCGAEASGWDLSLSEAEMLECVNGHTVCEGCIDSKTLNYLYDNYADEDKDTYWEDWRYELPEKYCPICNFEVILDRDILKYLEKFHKINLEDIKDEIRTNFEKYSDFKEKLASEN